MKILYFSPRECWPLLSGGPLRDYSLAHELSRKAEVVYFGLCNQDQPPATVPGLPRVTLIPKTTRYGPLSLLKGLIGPTPVTLLNCYTAAAAGSLVRLLTQEHFHTIQLEGVHLRPYLPLIQRHARRTPIVCDWHDIHSEQIGRYGGNTGSFARQLYASRTASLLRRQEDLLLAECQVHLTCSERDRQELLDRYPKAHVEVIPNGTDTSRFPSRDVSASTSANMSQNVLFVGAMNFPTNIDGVLWFVEEIWPLILEQRSDLNLILAGCDPGPEIRALGSRHGITVTGTVDNVRPYYERARLAIVPLRIGSGTRLKILEAMAAGVPVVSTSIGAEGIAVTSGKDIVLADNPRDFAGAVLDLCGNDTQWRASAEAGKLLAKAYDWITIGERLYSVHESLR